MRSPPSTAAPRSPPRPGGRRGPGRRPRACPVRAWASPSPSPLPAPGACGSHRPPASLRPLLELLRRPAPGSRGLGRLPAHGGGAGCRHPGGGQRACLPTARPRPARRPSPGGGEVGLKAARKARVEAQAAATRAAWPRGPRRGLAAPEGPPGPGPGPGPQPGRGQGPEAPGGQGPEGPGHLARRRAGGAEEAEAALAADLPPVPEAPPPVGPGRAGAGCRRPPPPGAAPGVPPRRRRARRRGHPGQVRAAWAGGRRPGKAPRWERAAAACRGGEGGLARRHGAGLEEARSGAGGSSQADPEARGGAGEGPGGEPWPLPPAARARPRRRRGPCWRPARRWSGRAASARRGRGGPGAGSPRGRCPWRRLPRPAPSRPPEAGVSPGGREQEAAEKPQGGGGREATLTWWRWLGVWVPEPGGGGPVGVAGPPATTRTASPATCRWWRASQPEDVPSRPASGWTRGGCGGRRAARCAADRRWAPGGAG